MKTLMITLLALFIGTAVTFAQQKPSGKGTPKTYQKVPAGTVVKDNSAAKTDAAATKSTGEPANAKAGQPATTKKSSATPKKLVRVPMKGQKTAIPASTQKKREQ
jgi:hypothetical protein